MVVAAGTELTVNEFARLVEYPVHIVRDWIRNGVLNTRNGSLVYRDGKPRINPYAFERAYRRPGTSRRRKNYLNN